MLDTTGSSGLLPEVVAAVQLPRAAVGPSAAGQFHWGFVLAGSSGGDMVLKATGWNFGTPIPMVVICQARQSDNLDHGWSDQFGLQVIETGRDFVRVRIRRLDNNGSGWGQNLRIDMFIIE
jgi:hypothetical protein